MRQAIALLLGLTLVTIATPVQAAEHDYVGSGDAAMTCQAEGSPINVGGTCLVLPNGGTRTVSVDDMAGPVGMTIQFYTSDPTFGGQFVGESLVPCQATSATFTVSPGVTWVAIFVHGPINQAIHCPAGPPTGGLGGTITVT